MNDEEKEVEQGKKKSSSTRNKLKRDMRNMLIKVILVIVAVSLIAIFVYALVYAVVETVKNAADAIADFFTIDSDKEIIIEINDEQIDKIIDAIQGLNIDLDDLKLMGEKADDNDPDVQEKNKEALRKYIREFYEAQVVTQTLNSKPGILGSGKTYGTVYVYRISDKNSTEVAKKDQLDYIPYEEMQAKKESQSPDIDEYFSINAGQLIVAETVTTTTNSTYNSVIELRSIDYKSVISQYTTPMEFFLYLAIMTKNPEFASAVSDLAKDSEIHITLMDSVDIQEITTERTYYENSKSMDDAGVVNKELAESPTVEKQTTRIETKTLFPVVTYAKTWFCEQTIEYRQEYEDKEPVTSTPIENNEVEPELTEEETTKTWITNDVTVTTITGSTSKYDVEDTRGSVIDKTGNKGEGTKSFVGLLDVKFPIPNENRQEAAGGNFVSQAEWLLESLKNNPNLQNLEQIMRYVLYKYTGKDYGVTELDLSMFEAKEMQINTVTVGGNLSAFGTNLSREEFIQLVEAYNGDSDYKTYMVPYAGDFYDVCTENNVNPALAFAHACLETGYGSNSGCKNDKNYFGMAHYNGASSGSKYSTVAESIADYCKWVINNATPGTSAYSSNCSVAQEYATVETKLNGTPDTNIYVLYCRYAQLNATHDGVFGSPQWFTREVQGKECEHEEGSPTTVEEKAAYAVYTTEQRISIAKTIFGQSVLMGSQNFNVDTVQVAGYVYPHYLQNNYPGAYGTSTIPNSGCGPTSLAMILAGLKGDSSIDPYSVVNNINDYWPNGSYYVAGVGSSHCIFYNDFLSKYYGVTSQYGVTQTQALSALDSGYPVIAREEGHILAVIPAPDEYKSQGYRFYILDSARGHDGPYRTVEEANNVVKGNLEFLAIIKP